MSFLAIVAWTPGNRVAKYQEYATEGEAIAHVAGVAGTFPDAFVTPHPGSGFMDWLVDPVAKTLSVSQPPEILIEARTRKREAFITEAIVRIAAQVPDWDTLDAIKTVAGLWTSHLAANATPAQLVAKNIYLYVRDTVPAKLDAISDQAVLDAVDSTTADPFGDGTPWPS
jgi:hypothetical protein